MDVDKTYFEIELGSKVKDRITGFAGIAIARTEYYFSVPRVLVLSDKLLRGEEQEIWFDEVRLSQVSETSLRGFASSRKDSSGETK